MICFVGVLLCDGCVVLWRTLCDVMSKNVNELQMSLCVAVGNAIES